MKQREGKSPQEIDQIVTKYDEYYVPYITFVEQYMGVSSATVDHEIRSSNIEG